MNPTEALSIRLTSLQKRFTGLEENHTILASLHQKLTLRHEQLIDESLELERSLEGFTEALSSFCSSCVARDLPGCSDCPLFNSRSAIERG